MLVLGVMAPTVENERADGFAPPVIRERAAKPDLSASQSIVPFGV